MTVSGIKFINLFAVIKRQCAHEVISILLPVCNLNSYSIQIHIIELEIWGTFSIQYRVLHKPGRERQKTTVVCITLRGYVYLRKSILKKEELWVFQFFEALGSINIHSIKQEQKINADTNISLNYLYLLYCISAHLCSKVQSNMIRNKIIGWDRNKAWNGVTYKQTHTYT